MNVMRIEMKFSSCFQFRKIVCELIYFAIKFNQRSIVGYMILGAPGASLHFVGCKKQHSTKETERKAGNGRVIGILPGSEPDISGMSIPDNWKLAYRSLKLIAFHQLIAGYVQKVLNIVRRAVRQVLHECTVRPTDVTPLKICGQQAQSALPPMLLERISSPLTESPSLKHTTVHF